MLLDSTADHLHYQPTENPGHTQPAALLTSPAPSDLPQRLTCLLYYQIRRPPAARLARIVSLSRAGILQILPVRFLPYPVIRWLHPFSLGTTDQPKSKTLTALQNPIVFRAVRITVGAARSQPMSHFSSYESVRHQLILWHEKKTTFYFIEALVLQFFYFKCSCVYVSLNFEETTSFALFSQISMIYQEDRVE